MYLNALQNTIASRPDLYTPVTDFSAFQMAVVGIVDALCIAVTQTQSASSSVSTTHSVSATLSASTSTSASDAAVPLCAQVQCGKCGSRLECIVNSGSPKLDHAVCAVVTSCNKFCPKKPQEDGCMAGTLLSLAVRLFADRAVAMSEIALPLWQELACLPCCDYTPWRLW